MRGIFRQAFSQLEKSKRGPTLEHRRPSSSPKPGVTVGESEALAAGVAVFGRCRLGWFRDKPNAEPVHEMASACWSRLNILEPNVDDP